MKVPGLIYRLGRKPDPWSVPDWASAGPDGTFGNRFDDPEGMYRVLYASSQRLGCFLETLGRFRVDPRLLAELAEIEGEDDYFPLGEVPLEWTEKRMMGVATAGGEYADICSSEWIGRLRNLLAVDLVKFGFDDLDASVLQQTAPRNPQVSTATNATSSPIPLWIPARRHRVIALRPLLARCATSSRSGGSTPKVRTRAPTPSASTTSRWNS